MEIYYVSLDDYKKIIDNEYRLDLEYMDLLVRAIILLGMAKGIVPPDDFMEKCEKHFYLEGVKHAQNSRAPTEP